MALYQIQRYAVHREHAWPELRGQRHPPPSPVLLSSRFSPLLTRWRNTPPCFTLAFWLLHQSIHIITLDIYISFTLDTSFFSPHAVRDLLHLLEPTFVNRDLSGSLNLLGDGNLLPTHGNPYDFILANGRIGNLTRTRTMFDIHFFMKNGYVNCLLLGHNFLA